MVASGARQFALVDDGDRLAAELVEGLALDTYVYHPSDGQKDMSIVTDRETRSIRFPHGRTVDFAIAYRGKIYPQRLAPVEQHRWRGPDAVALPFRLGAGNTILIQGSINGSPPLDLLFDTGASVSVLARRGVDSGAAPAQGSATIRLGAVEVANTPLVSIDYGTSLQADGVLGYNIFMGRQVTIDYGRRELRIGRPRDRPPAGFRTVPLTWRGARTMVAVGIDDGRAVRTVPMLLDTGSRWALSLDNRDPLARGADHLPALGWRIARRADGGRVVSRVLTLPKVSIGGLVLANVQADVELPGARSRLAVPILGNDVLKRFDLVIDYRRGVLHLRPNALVAAPYHRVGLTRTVVTATLLGLATALAALAAWRLRRRRPASGAALGRQR